MTDYERINNGRLIFDVCTLVRIYLSAQRVCENSSPSLAISSLTCTFLLTFTIVSSDFSQDRATE